MDICRLCGSDRQIFNVFDEMFTCGENLRTYILLSTGVHMKREDPMTTCICDKCLKVILNMFLFRKKSVNHDRKLKRQFGVSKELIVAKNLQEVVQENERIVAEMRENWEQKSVGIQVDFWTNGLQKSKNTSKRKSVAQAGKTPRKRKKTTVSFLKIKEEFPNLSFPRSAKTANLLPRVFLQKMEIAKPKKIDNVLPSRRKYLRSFRRNQMEHKQDFEKRLENYEHLDLENREKLYFSSLELARSSENSLGNSVNGESRNIPESRVCVSEFKSESLQNVEGCPEGNCNVANVESNCKPVVKKRVYRKKIKGTTNIFPSSWNGRRGVVGVDGLCMGSGGNRNSNQSVFPNTPNVPPTSQGNIQNPNQGQTLSQLLIFSPVKNQNEGSPSSSAVQNSSCSNDLVNLKPFQIHSAIPCLVQVNPSNSKQDTLTITPISQSLIQNQNVDNSSRDQTQTEKSSTVSSPSGVVNNLNQGSFPKNTPNSYCRVKVPNFPQNAQAQNSPTHSPVLNSIGKLYLPTGPYSLPQNPSFPKNEQTLNPPTHSPVPDALRDFYNPTLPYSLPQNPSFPKKVKPRKTRPSVLRKNRASPQNPQVFPQSSSSQVTIQIQNPTANASIKNQTVLFISHHPAQNRNSFPKTQEEVPKLAPIAARLVHIQPKPNGFSVTPSTLSIVPCNEQNAIFPQEQLHPLPTAPPYSRTKIVYSNNANLQNAASPLPGLPNPQEDSARKVFDGAEMAFLRGVLQRQNGPQHAVYKIVPSGRAQETPKDFEFAKLRPMKYQRVRTSKAAEIPPTVDTLAPQ